MDYPSVEAVLFDFTGVVAGIRMAFIGEPGGPYRVEPVKEVIDGIVRLRHAGIVTGLVSNNDRDSLFAMASNVDFGALFDVTAFSSDVGSGKPDRQIFDYALRRIEREANRCLFIDDVARNVDAAIDLGMHGLVADRPSAVVSTINGLLKAR